MTPIQAARRYPDVLVALLASAAVSWWWTIERMAGMDVGPGTELGTLGWFTVSWALMMAAMMLPSFAPTLTAYVTLSGRDQPTRGLLFACGYLLAWTAAGVIAYGVVELGAGLFAGDLAWRSGGRWLSAGIIATAVAYQFIPSKAACQARCRGTLDGTVGTPGMSRAAALAMGARSGTWCIGCSWALMGALFALGVMSVTWMALIAVLIAVEKASPWPRGARLATATVLTALAVGILAAPHDVPGLVIPGSAAMHSMNAMR